MCDYRGGGICIVIAIGWHLYMCGYREAFLYVWL